jgi:hypothetical protein
LNFRFLGISKESIESSHVQQFDKAWPKCSHLVYSRVCKMMNLVWTNFRQTVKNKPNASTLVKLCRIVVRDYSLYSPWKCLKIWNSNLEISAEHWVNDETIVCQAINACTTYYSWTLARLCAVLQCWSSWVVAAELWEIKIW